MKQIPRARLCGRGGSEELQHLCFLEGLGWEAAARPSLLGVFEAQRQIGQGWPYSPWSVARNPGLGWGVKGRLGLQG